MTENSKSYKFTPMQLKSASRVAKKIVYRCVRNTSIERIHEGKPLNSAKTDYSDIKVLTPAGEIPWNEVSRISDEEMKRFNQEVLNKIFTVLLYIDKNEEMPDGRHAFRIPANWDEPQIDPFIASIFEHPIADSGE